jgi:hypothetical protein
MAGEKPTREGLIYDFFVDEASRLGQRTDWFLIFHAILLEAFLSATEKAGAPTPDNHPHVIVIGILGFLTAYLWFMSGFRQRWLLRHLGACMEHEPLMGLEVSRLFGTLFRVRREGYPALSRGRSLCRHSRSSFRSPSRLPGRCF